MSRASLVLDAGALIAVDRADRATCAVIDEALAGEGELIVPAGVLAQVWRGGARQARLARLINARGVCCEALTRERALAAGGLCGAHDTADVVDASVVLAARAHHAPALSSDRSDLRHLDPKIWIIDC